MFHTFSVREQPDGQPAAPAMRSAGEIESLATLLEWVQHHPGASDLQTETLEFGRMVLLWALGAGADLNVYHNASMALLETFISSMGKKMERDYRRNGPPPSQTTRPQG